MVAWRRCAQVAAVVRADADRNARPCRAARRAGAGGRPGAGGRHWIHNGCGSTWPRRRRTCRRGRRLRAGQACHPGHWHPGQAGRARCGDGARPQRRAGRRHGRCGCHGGCPAGRGVRRVLRRPARRLCRHGAAGAGDARVSPRRDGLAAHGGAVRDRHAGEAGGLGGQGEGRGRGDRLLRGARHHHGRHRIRSAAPDPGRLRRTDPGRRHRRGAGDLDRLGTAGQRQRGGVRGQRRAPGGRGNADRVPGGRREAVAALGGVRRRRRPRPAW